MTNEEYYLLDELYFVTSFSSLLSSLEWEEEMLKSELFKLYEKGWVLCFKTVDEEIVVSNDEFQANYGQYYYLASKQGLLKHNSSI